MMMSSWREDSAGNQEPVEDGNSDEQAQYLLGSEKKIEHVRKQRSWHRRRQLWLIACGLLGCGLVALLLLYESKQAAHDVVAQALTVQRPSYLLSQDWHADASPRRREYFWTIRDQLHNPDGVFRPMILVNNMFPGPLIEANEGDTIVVHVDNRAVNATSIHWHGLYQNGTPHMDGTVGITQCPIAPGRQFMYEFNVTGQHGTYWWHGHQGVQTSDGLHGPLVIRGRREHELQKLDYDSDQVVLLSDHYHDLSAALMFQYLMPDAENAEPVPQSGLINGQGMRDCHDFLDRECEVHTRYPMIVLEQGKRHRLRLINAGAFAEFQFQIDEHELAVTEVDGTDVNPKYYHRLNINTAQRYSVVVHANTTDQAHFWMRARMIAHCFTNPPATLDVDALAVVRYGNEQNEMLPSSQDWDQRLDLECRDLNTTELIPVDARAPPPTPNAVFYLRTNFEIGAYRLSRGYFNTSSWRANVHSPSLHRVSDAFASSKLSVAQPSRPAENGPEAAFVSNQAFDTQRELVIQSSGIQTIDLLVSNFDDGNHPLHLHGYKYWVLAQGHGGPPLTRDDAAIDRESLTPLYDSLNITNPLRRDTASVEAFGWILIRVVADNPGIWALHCHVAWHAEAGLLMQLLTRADGLEHLHIPPANIDLCNAPDLETGMAPVDAVFEDFAK